MNEALDRRHTVNKQSILTAALWLGLGIACACWGEWWLARGCAAVALLAAGLGVVRDSNFHS